MENEVHSSWTLYVMFLGKTTLQILSFESGFALKHNLQGPGGLIHLVPVALYLRRKHKQENCEVTVKTNV